MAYPSMAKKTNRDDELSTRPKVHKRLLEVFRDVEKGFADQRDRSDQNIDYWEIYNNVLGDRQFYNGTSQIFLPITHDAIEARKTRFCNQIFPRSGRYVEVTTTDESQPYATMALLEYYVRKAYLRTQVMPALMVSGDVEGQYSIYVGWRETTKAVTYRQTEPVKVNGLEFPQLGEVEHTRSEKQTTGAPFVEVLNDCDILVLPATADSIEEALEVGGSVTVMRRWTKHTIKKMIDDGEFEEEAGEALVSNMSRKDTTNRTDTKKQLADAAGIKVQRGDKFAMGYETWTKLKIDGEHRICRAYYGGDDQVLGCKLNPYWCDEVPIISTAVHKSPGVFKGRSLVADVVDVQVLANDTINEAADTAHFAAMPIIMTNPEKNPRVGSMVLGLAAVWETSPQDTQFAQFPPLWKDGFTIAAACKQQIFQTLGVNPAMMPQQTGTGQKRNQAEIANEQQVDLLTTADAVTNIEEGILTPMLYRFAAYDQQFRDDDMLVRGFGELGMTALMEEVPPIQMGRRWEYKWFGVEQARNAAMMQQQIAGLNVVKGIPPQLLPGRRLNLAPAVDMMMVNLYGSRVAPLIFQDLAKQLSVDPDKENEMLSQGFDLQTHPPDDDPKHMQEHMEGMKGGDPHGTFRAHIMRHQAQMQQKSQAQQQQQGGLPGGPGGAGPGVAGAPKPGGQPQGPRLLKGPAGMIPPDQLAKAGAVTMPRRA